MTVTVQIITRKLMLLPKLMLVLFASMLWVQPAAAEKLPVETFAQLPSVSMLRISPDGEYIAMLRPMRGVPHLVVQKADGSASPIAIPAPQDAQIAKFHWANSERLLIHSTRKQLRGRIETVERRLLAVNRDGSDYENIVYTAMDNRHFSRLQSKYSRAQIQDNVISYLPDDPNHILLSMDEKMDGLSDVRMVNINTGRFDMLRDAMRGVQDWMSDQQGRLRVGWGFDNHAFDMGRTTNKFLYYSGTDDVFREVAEDHLASRLDVLAFAEDPNIAFMAGDNDHGRRAIVLTDMSSGEVIETLFSHDQYDAASLIRDPLSRAPIGVFYVGESRQSEIFDEDWARRYKTINSALKDTFNIVVSTTADRKMHVVFAKSEREPGVFYLYDEANKAIHPLALSYNDLDPNQLAEVKAISYPARDGTAIPAYLTVPKDSDGTNMPTVILPHGGPHVRDSMEFDYLAQFLASRGYAVLQPNFRGSYGYGREFLEAGYEQWGLLMQDDVTDGTRWLMQQGIADPNRTCIVGWSYGGYAALMGAAKEPDLYKCSVSINGVSDIQRLLNYADDYIGGTVITQHINQESLKEVSPVFLADQIKAPVLLIATDDDATVQVRHSKNMAKALKRKKVPHRYVEIEEGGHSLMNEASRLETLQELEAWLAKYIGD